MRKSLAALLFNFRTIVFVSCKVIALFLHDGQALKDCFEFIAGAGGWVVSPE